MFELAPKRFEINWVLKIAIILIQMEIILKRYISDRFLRVNIWVQRTSLIYVVNNECWIPKLSRLHSFNAFEEKNAAFALSSRIQFRRNLQTVDIKRMPIVREIFSFINLMGLYTESKTAQWNRSERFFFGSVYIVKYFGLFVIARESHDENID